jgi:hypothetical protein
MLQMLQFFFYFYKKMKKSKKTPNFILFYIKKAIKKVLAFFNRLIA